MTIKEFTLIICFTRLASSVPYQYSGYSSMVSTPSYSMKQSVNNDSPKKYNVGYKVQEDGTTKVKKEFSNSEYLNLFAPDSLKRPFSNNELTFDETYSTTAAPLLQYPYPGQLKINLAPEYAPKPDPLQPYSPDIATNKIYHHDKAHHLVHDVVGHFITDVAGHKLKHVGEVLQSGEVTEPIIHKLSLAKAALLQLLAILGPLSAIKTIHFVAKASDPHHPHHPEHEENVESYVPPAPVPVPLPIPAEVAEYEPTPHYPPTLIGMILHFVAQLSKFNTEAKVHLIPNLLKVLSRTSTSSAHVSGHIPH